jgi:tetratricopeptide (TPR) repeat protein
MSPVSVSKYSAVGEDILQWLVRADRAINEEFPPNIELAFSSYQKALELDPDCVPALDGLGELLSNLGDSERAIEVLLQSVRIEPESGPSKYFYLGQMLNGKDALQSYNKCISIASAEMSASIGDEFHEETRSQLISVYCAIGELFMTDLCDEDCAETECQSAFTKALELNCDSIEALTGISTFHRMRLEIEQSKQFCLKAFDSISNLLESNEFAEIGEIAPFPLRLRLSENCVELGLIDEGLVILSTLLDEDEEDLQSWFLTGCCHLVGKQSGEAFECIKQAKRLLKKNRAHMDPEALKHWSKEFSELENRINSDTIMTD